MPFPPTGDLPHPGIELVSPALAGGFFTAEPPGNPQVSKADIYNKSSIVSHPDNYSVNGLKQTWACNRHIVGFYCSLVLCVSEQSKPETQKRIPSKLVCFTGRN